MRMRNKMMMMLMMKKLMMMMGMKKILQETLNIKCHYNNICIVL